MYEYNFITPKTFSVLYAKSSFLIYFTKFDSSEETDIEN